MDDLPRAANSTVEWLVTEPTISNCKYYALATKPLNHIKLQIHMT